jgi:hypothetical protein
MSLSEIYTVPTSIPNDLLAILQLLSEKIYAVNLKVKDLNFDVSLDSPSLSGLV